MTEVKNHPFQAEVSQVLSLVVNSLYSNKEIFLRELVSNSSDALDKLRFAALSDKELLGEGETLGIQISIDEDNGTLTVSDNGIGMSQQELIDNLGTIARSGTREFTQLVKEAVQAKESGTQLIGQFGVGFYSAYLVADRVEVISQAAKSNEAYRWESEAKDGFTVSAATRGARGTSVVLHLKQEQRDYLKPHQIKEVIRRHSDYVSHPIELSYVQKKDSGSTDELERKVETINQASALWQRNPKEITVEQYGEFYKHLAHDWEEPLAYKHFRVEGTQMFTGIVFIPESARAELLDPRGEHGVRLHVRRVLAMESCEELLPKWLRFVRGVVDSEDLPLNVSRETLQDSKQVKLIRKQVVSQIVGMIEELAQERPADYDKFYRNFGAVLKEGLHFEPEQKDRLARLVRFKSTYEAPKVGDENQDTKTEANGDMAPQPSSWVSLADYVKRMKSEQEAIYYVEGPSLEVLKSSPHLEKLRKNGIEVLLMTDGVDPFALETLTDFDGKKLVNAGREGLDLNEEQAEETPEAKEAHASFVGRLKGLLSNRVSDVRMSTRLAESPACLVTPDGGLPPHLEAMFRAQNLSVPQVKRILEVNPQHQLVVNMQRLAEVNPDAPELRDWGELLIDQALIAEGNQVDEPSKLAARLTSLLTAASQLALTEVASKREA
jgi:molecular chaperone HtpG